uniref:SOCS box domain-containing protein n=1 Tax=Trichogramma kaykai TaxID=54128 RepID=A0ABD2VUF0_9HYME
MFFDDYIESRRVEANEDVKFVGSFNQKVTSKRARAEINWDSERERRDLIIELSDLIRNSKDQHRKLNLRDILRPEEIESLLEEAVYFWDEDECHDYRRECIVLFVESLASTGYRDKPRLGWDNQPSLRRTTPLHHAARRWISNWDSLIRNLFTIYDRYDANYMDEHGLTHFHVACRFGLQDVVEGFLELGQEPNYLAPKSLESPLQLALAHGHEKVARLLLRRGANPSLAYREGLTALHTVCKGIEGNCALADMMMELAGGSGEKRKHAVRVNAQDDLGRTPLHLALDYGDRRMSEWLLRKGANANLANNDGSTPLHLVSERDGDEHDLAEMIFKLSHDYYKPLNVDAWDESGNTALHLAIKNGFEKLVQVLLRNGACPNSFNRRGLTPLHICLEKEDNDLLRLFFRINGDIRRKVQVDARDELGQTPLQWAMTNLKPDVVDILVDNGASLSSFVIPTKHYFREGNDDSWYGFRLKLASGILAVVERLTLRGYRLNRNDAMKIMNIFYMYELFDKSVDLKKYLCNDETFVREAKNVTICSNLSLKDLILLPPVNMEKFITYTDYYQFARSRKLSMLSHQFREPCALHLCERMSKDFFREWAVDPLMRLTRYELPPLCCEKIADRLLNQDLYHICLVTARRRSWRRRMRKIFLWCK